MGLLDVFNKKEEDKMDALVREIKNNYGSVEPYDKLISYIESKKYVTDFAIITEDDLISVFKVIMHLIKDNELLIEHAIILYNNILYSSSKNDIDLFIKTLNECKNRKFAGIINSISNLFSDKKIALSLSHDIVDCNFTEDTLNKVVSYMSLVRQYYVDEIAYQARVNQVLTTVKSIPASNDSLDEFIASCIKQDEMQVGIYTNIDENRLFELNKRIDSVVRDINNIDANIDKINLRVVSLTNEVEARIKELVDDKTKTFEEKYESITKIISDARTSSLDVVKSAKENIEALGNHYLGLLSDKAVSKGLKKEKVESIIKTETVEEKKNNFTTNIILDGKNYQSIASKIKNSNMYFHKSFDKILRYVLIKDPLMLIGETGSGKSYIIKQLSQILNLEIYNLGFVRDEYASIKGYNDANGKYIKTPFYDVLKNGGLCVINEIDNSECKALIELHDFLDDTGYQPYRFPNGEKVTPHPNFTLITTANTWGNGADRNYVAREPIDKATLNRFTKVPVEYDRLLEEQISSGNSDILEIIKYYNMALSERNNDEILTTRDLGRIKKQLESGIIYWEDIINDKLIRNLSPDLLNAIINSMDSHIINNKKYDQFKQKVKSL